MYAKGKGSSVPSDAQAREKLALYVYEYLLHVGAQKSAQTFLSEIRWEKNITLGEPPGFLHSWWCVFWDLYCAAPERRDTCDHSSEAKAFHDYGFVNSGYSVNGMAPNAAAPSPLGQMPPQDGMPGGPIPPSFFPGGSQPSPHPSGPHNPMMGPNQPFMSPRYPGGPRGPGPGPVRLPNQIDFNPPPGSTGGPMPGMPNNMDPRPGVYITGHPSMGMQRINHPGVRMPGPMNPNYSGMRGPPPNPGMGPGPGGMPPMSIMEWNGMAIKVSSPQSSGHFETNIWPGGPGGPGPGRPWPPTSSSSLNYSSASPGSYNGPVSGPPGTPIHMPSPQGDSANSGDGMYGMMKPGGMPGMPGFMGGPDGMPMGPGDMPPVMNGDMDGMKNSPANGPGTPRDNLTPVSGPGPDMGPYGLGGYQENDQIESAAILKIKESMQEEAKRFEKDGENPEYFMQ
ncbi:single-stranded DNA-binding protein 3 isoform X4 [Patella vulgata]|uniref:single-stranded DNA-binding protein 3 isoform X4 n=1 Tax=Patella vulgata TaxID=6465 RepID=UPI002180448D|nr:single-stranded DNA-binding protein 3 isoform X4 [Patella vulgata]